MGLPDRVPGMKPGGARRNAVVGTAATGTGGPTTGGGTVEIGVATPASTGRIATPGGAA